MDKWFKKLMSSPVNPPSLPPLILPPSLADGTEAGALLSSVEAACGLLTDYNARLGAELAERRHVARMLRDFIAAQKVAIQDAEEKLQVRWAARATSKTLAKWKNTGQTSAGHTVPVVSRYRGDV
jgi:hypothetical protein